MTSLLRDLSTMLSDEVKAQTKRGLNRLLGAVGNRLQTWRKHMSEKKLVGLIKIQPPSVGRDIHYHNDGGPYAGKITAINPDGTVDLMTYGRNSIYFNHNVPMGGPEGKTKVHGSWTWPDFVPAVEVETQLLNDVDGKTHATYMRDVSNHFTIKYVDLGAAARSQRARGHHPLVRERPAPASLGLQALRVGQSGCQGQEHRVVHEGPERPALRER